VAVALLAVVLGDDFGVQGRSQSQRELLDAESVAGHLLKAGSVFAFPGAGQCARGVMASVITLQALHGLSDAETVDAVMFDLRWKAACGRAGTAGAFHATTLTYRRRRLRTSDRPNRILDAVIPVDTCHNPMISGPTRLAEILIGRCRLYA